MEYAFEFSWISNVSDDDKRSAEEAIRSTQKSNHSPVVFCHSGAVAVTLSSPDPLQATLIGNMTCSCGKPRGIIRGRIDGSDITFEAVRD